MRWQIIGFAFYASTPSDGARLVYELRRALAAMVLRAWMRGGVSHVALVGSLVVTPAGPRHKGATWRIDAPEARELVIASIALGVQYEEIPDLMRGGTDLRAQAGEMMLALESVDVARREVP